MIPTCMATAILLIAATAAAIPPPIYDFCPVVVEVQPDALGHFTYTGDTCDGDNLVVDHDCPVWTQTHGSEDYFAIALDSGASFTAAVSHEGDAMLMVTAECIVYGTMFTCLAGSNTTGPGGIESVTYVNDTGDAAVVYLVIDTEDTADCGGYAMVLSVHGTVPATTTSWGTIKRSYR